MPGLHRGQLLELRRCGFQVLIKVVREDGEVAGIACVARESAFDAAIVVVADAIELRRICNRQRAQQDALHQREDGGVGADTQGQRDDCGEREARRLAQLAQCVAEVLKELIHRVDSILRCVFGVALLFRSKSLHRFDGSRAAGRGHAGSEHGEQQESCRHTIADWIEGCDSKQHGSQQPHGGNGAERTAD